MSERSQETRRRQRRAGATRSSDRTVDRFSDLGRVATQPAWVTCRRCRQPFHSGKFYDTCFDCWLAEHPTRR